MPRFKCNNPNISSEDPTAPVRNTTFNGISMDVFDVTGITLLSAFTEMTPNILTSISGALLSSPRRRRRGEANFEGARNGRFPASGATSSYPDPSRQRGKQGLDHPVGSRHDRRSIDREAAR